MTRSILATCGALAMAGITAAAQPPTQPPSTDRNASQTLTLTGCLKTGDSSTMGMPPASTTTDTTTKPGAAGTTPTYVLTNVEHSGTKPMTPGSTTMPKPGTAGDAMAHSTYLLMAKDASVNFAPHLNHKVEVTGMTAARGMHDMSKPANPPATTKPPTGEGRPDSMHDAAKQAPAQTLTVSALKMVSATCP